MGRFSEVQTAYIGRGAFRFRGFVVDTSVVSAMSHHMYGGFLKIQTSKKTPFHLRREGNWGQKAFYLKERPIFKVLS